MGDLHTLASKLETLTANLESEVSRCSVEVAQDIHFALVTGTPVDTSKALSNWQVTLEAPMLDEIEAYSPGTKGSSRGASMGVTIQEGRSVLASKRFGQSIFISNNVSYIGDLDRGTSKQAPSGFLQQSLLIGRRKVKSFKIKLRF